MGFILNGKPFAIKSAELFATIHAPDRRRKYWPRRNRTAGDPRIFWSLEVWAAGEIDGAETDARVMAEEMHFPVRRWIDLAERTVEWAGRPGEKADGRPYGCFYLEEHDMIDHARLRIAERDGVAFRFEWEGVCKAYLYEHDVPFSASGWATFTGVSVYENGAGSDESMRDRLALYLDPRDFVQGTLLCRSDRQGYFRHVESCHTVFTPSEAATTFPS